jgi:hypothetical protein
MKIEMFIGMFLIHYIFMSYIHINRTEDFTNSIGKLYITIIIGLCMVILDICTTPKFDKQHFFFFLFLTLVIIFFYKIQFGMGEKNYLREMIEHHSMAVLTSKNILEKTKNPEVIKLATTILTTQEKEIADMKYLLKSI